MKHQKKNAAVFFGGCSPEYSVSLASAAAVVQHLNLRKYHPVLVGITADGDWFHYTGGWKAIADDCWQNSADCTPAAFSPDRSRPGLLHLSSEGSSLIPIDVALPVLHGRNGEDGTLQGMLELAGIPLAGCGVLASALSMDKERAHRMASAAGIRVPRSLVVYAPSQLTRVCAFAKETGFPLFIKPCRAGSSYGITRVTSESGLADALEKAFAYDDTVVIEEAVDGVEVGCAILGTDQLTVGEIDEIELSQGFFDFTEKYTLKTSSIHVPARIEEAKAREIKEIAQTVYRTMGCSGFARVDMFLRSDGAIFFNEVNTIPGFTQHSRYPGMMEAAGLSFTELLDKILDEAVNR